MIINFIFKYWNLDIWKQNVVNNSYIESEQSILQGWRRPRTFLEDKFWLAQERGKEKELHSGLEGRTSHRKTKRGHINAKGIAQLKAEYEKPTNFVHLIMNCFKWLLFFSYFHLYFTFIFILIIFFNFRKKYTLHNK